jgi:xylulokinase
VKAHTIGIDIGTTGTKTVLLDTERGIVAQASRETTLHSPSPGFAEADTGQWYRNVFESIREILSTSGIRGDAVDAVAVSGMVPAVVPLDGRGTPLRRAILQNDARAHREVSELASALDGVDLVTMTGSALTQQSVAPTTAWLRTHEPDVYDRTAHYVGSYDWVLIALGADVHVEQNWALESGLFTIGSSPRRQGRRIEQCGSRVDGIVGGHPPDRRWGRSRPVGLRRRCQRTGRCAGETRRRRRHPGRQRHQGGR